MTVDVRGEVTCSLGPLISASISDDYVQGSGLIKTSGSCEIADIIVPDIGTVVTFTHTPIGGSPVNVPRKLRVLSSFADPFRRITSVELGCILTYKEDLTEKVDWSVYDDPENSDFEEGVDDLIVVVPVSASYLASICTGAIDFPGGVSDLGLTNRFSIKKSDFDFSSGYVSVLSDLLVSESRCGYVDFNEALQVFDLDLPASGETPLAGVPVFYGSDFIDIGSINSGQIPGEAVTVSYSSLKLKVPEIDPDEEGEGEGEGEGDPNVEESLIVSPAEGFVDQNTGVYSANTGVAVVSYSLKPDLESQSSGGFVNIPSAEEFGDLFPELQSQTGGGEGDTLFKGFPYQEKTWQASIWFTLEVKTYKSESDREPTEQEQAAWDDAQAAYLIAQSTPPITEQEQADYDAAYETYQEIVKPGLLKEPEELRLKAGSIAMTTDNIVNIAPKWISEALSIGIDNPGNWQTIKSLSVTTYTYNQLGEEIGSVQYNYSNAMGLLGDSPYDLTGEVEQDDGLFSGNLSGFGTSGTQYKLVSPVQVPPVEAIRIGPNVVEEITAPWSENIESGTEPRRKVEATVKNSATVTINPAVGIPARLDGDTEFSKIPSPGNTWGMYLSDRTENYTEYRAGFTRQTTLVYGSRAQTLAGQQFLAETRAKSAEARQGENLTIQQAQSAFAQFASFTTAELVLLTTSVSEQKTSSSSGGSSKETNPIREEKPTIEDELREEQAEDSGDPNNGYRTESTAGLELALGSPLAKRRIEFSMPYAPDDRFVKFAINPIYRSFPSDAPAKARTYGRVQNNLLLGNRFGMNIQTSIGRMPTGPLSPIIICADGFCALYRVNGTSWTMDSNGIIVSTDALFWGGVGTY